MAASIRKITNDSELNRLLNANFFHSEARKEGYVEVGEDNFCLPALYYDYEEKIRNFQVRDDDVYIISHPKTGTTWCQEMVWLIVNDFDYDGTEQDILVRFPLLETPAYFDCDVVKAEVVFGCHPWEYMGKHPSPRCLKTHFHWSLLPQQIIDGTKNPKIISILRNPRDTCVSFYHHCRLMEGYTGTFEDFVELFLAGKVLYGPYWKSVLSVWEQRYRSNLLFLKFKEMKEDLPGVIRKVANFLQKPITDEQVEKLAQHLSFQNMKENPAVNYKNIIYLYADRQGMNIAKNGEFMRSGTEGSYKVEMTPELIQRFEEWEKKHLDGTDLTFD